MAPRKAASRTDRHEQTVRKARRVDEPEPTPAARVARKLSIRPRDLELYRTALTHRSAAGDPWKRPDDGPSATSNERLEFLGDAILGAIAAEVLYKRFPDATEGLLTRRRSAIVRTEQLTRWARELGLGEDLYLSQSERISTGGKDRILTGAFEALIGAVALDQGLPAAKRLVERLIYRDVDQILAGLALANPKGRLQELTQDLYQHAPSYHTLQAEGPAHARHFTVEVRFRGVPLATGSGPSKQSAEEDAASAALERLDREGPLALERTRGDRVGQ